MFFFLKEEPMGIIARDRVYLKDVENLEFTLKYSGGLVAGMPHGKGIHNKEGKISFA